MNSIFYKFITIFTILALIFYIESDTPILINIIDTICTTLSIKSELSYNILVLYILLMFIVIPMITISITHFNIQKYRGNSKRVFIKNHMNAIFYFNFSLLISGMLSLLLLKYSKYMLDSSLNLILFNTSQLDDEIVKIIHTGFLVLVLTYTSSLYISFMIFGDGIFFNRSRQQSSILFPISVDIGIVKKFLLISLLHGIPYNVTLLITYWILYQTLKNFNKLLGVVFYSTIISIVSSFMGLFLYWIESGKLSRIWSNSN